MKLQDFAEGCYELALDVDNPRADRRHRRDAGKVPIWVAGSQWRIAEDGVPGLLPDLPPLKSLRAIPSGTRITNERQLAALLPNLKPMPESYMAWAERVELRFWHAEVIELLLDQGKLTRADIEALIELAEKRFDEQNG